MCQHRGIGHSQEIIDNPNIVERTIPNLLKNVLNVSKKSIAKIGDFVSCQTEGCTNKVIHPLFICASCSKKTLDTIVEAQNSKAEYFVCDVCRGEHHINFFIECRARGNEINRCANCAKRHSDEYE